ncbi:MAG: heme-binding protein [Clostridia bacterium]|nr:heme-binding protein [Clostridia bacterium]MBQ3553710.1 heme-binding protein [Clostridia bacterium]
MNEHEIARLVKATVSKMYGEDKPEGLSDMTLDVARKLIRKVEDKAAEMGLSVVVAVSNRAARPVAVECMDDSYIVSYDVAVKKAFTVVAIKMSTKELKPLCQPGAPLYGIELTNDGQIVIFGGGVPLKVSGQVIGGLGVSGGTEEQDTYLAEYGASVFEEELSCQ